MRLPYGRIELPASSFRPTASRASNRAIVAEGALVIATLSRMVTLTDLPTPYAVARSVVTVFPSISTFST